MPRNRNDAEPPPVMTWGKATPILSVAALFDLVRIFFQMFWFFGPALAALYCTSTVSGWVGSLWGLTATACGAGAVVAGAAISEFTIPFGVVMAMAVGLFGFLTLGWWILMKNARILKANAVGGLWLGGSFLVSQVPLIGTIPAFTIVLWKLYRTQIRVEKRAYQKWEKEQSDARLQERNQQTARLMQAEAAELASAEVY